MNFRCYSLTFDIWCFECLVADQCNFKFMPFVEHADWEVQQNFGTLQGAREFCVQEGATLLKASGIRFTYAYCAAKRSDTMCGKLRVGGFIFTCENTGEYADVHLLVGDRDGKAFVPAHQLILKNFPFDICRLSNLQVLYLGGNALIDVPDTIGQLSELTSLGLADNRLEQIPTAIASYRNLRNLALHNNRLKKFLPPRIVRLKNLEYLSLSNNPLVTDVVNEIPFSSASESDDDHSQHFRHHHRAHQGTPSDSFTSISANAKMKVFLG